MASTNTDAQFGEFRFQWMLFVVSGFGWLVDNMMIQGLAISLPFLPREFVKTEQEARQATLALTVGMIFGAFFRCLCVRAGTRSDPSSWSAVSSRRVTRDRLVLELAAMSWGV